MRSSRSLLDVLKFQIKHILILVKDNESKNKMHLLNEDFFQTHLPCVKE